MNDFEILKSGRSSKTTDDACFQRFGLVFWCVKLETRFWSQSDCNKWAEEKVLLYKIDFPQYHSQTPEEKKQNSELAGQYGVNAFPTVILLQSDGAELARTGYQHGGASNYVAMLKTTLGK